MFAGITNPDTWATIAERVGIPFALLLMILMFLGVGVWWFARNVGKPLIASHMNFVNATMESGRSNALANATNAAAIQKLTEIEEMKAKTTHDILLASNKTSEMMTNSNSKVQELMTGNNDKLDDICELLGETCKYKKCENCEPKTESKK